MLTHHFGCRMYPANIGEWLFVDIIAGVSVTVMLIPMVLAYALIAHVPLQNGLYSAYMGEHYRSRFSVICIAL